MNNGLEIRWHGRGGQGAKTAALLLADVAFKTGKYVQGFPEYGPERMGAPITAYNRISDEVIRVHSNIYTPGLVVVVDETLLHSVDVTAGLKEDGAIIVNTPKSADEIKPMLNGYQGKVYTVDARKISVQALGKYFPNSPMLAAAVAVSGVMKKDAFISEMRASYQHKFAKKPEVIDGNMQALELTYEEFKRCIIKTYFKWRYNNMRTDISKINEQTPHQDLTEGLMLFAGGTSKQFHTGEWRTRTPILDQDLCRQCMVCSMVCPDSSIPLKDGERVEFDYDHCKGCGICAKACPFDAITMKEGR